MSFSIRLLTLAVTLLLAFAGYCLGQEITNVEGLCLFDSDEMKESLYTFPPDKRSLNLFNELLAKSGKQLRVKIRAANVPQVGAAEHGNERLLLYNQFVLEQFEKEDTKNWQVLAVIAHQIGHHANNHAFVLEDRMRTEIEIEADRFAGYLLFRLGAAISDIEALHKFLDSQHQNPRFPLPRVRLDAFIEGWHDGKAEQGGALAFDIPEENVPKFPSWPPPQASGNMEIPQNLIPGKALRPRLMDVAAQLLTALDTTGYGERSFYSIPDGFALVSRIEQIYPDGRPKEGAERWPVTAEPPRIFSLRSYLQALFTSNPGYYRVIVFVVTDQPLVQKSADPTEYNNAPRDWVWSGANKIPTSVGFMDYTSAMSCTALIYEFRQASRNSPVSLDLPGLLPGKAHLEQSSLLKALTK